MIHKITYSWTGWPKVGYFPQDVESTALSQLKSAWKNDEIHRVCSLWREEKIQITIRSNPQTSAATVAARVKGRLDHQLRTQGWAGGFKRKVGLRSLGNNTIKQVLRYVATQLERSDLADPRYVQHLADATWENPALDLSVPIVTAHGRYWNDFHVVVVARDRSRLATFSRMLTIRTAAIQWGYELTTGNALSGQCGLKLLSLMPDHVHMVIRLPVEAIPEDVAGGLLRLLNNAAGNAFYSERVYMGSFSIYGLGCITRRS